MLVSELPEIFREAVAPEVHTYSIGKPYIQNGYVYATDGTMMVRMPCPPEGVTGAATEGKLPCDDGFPWSASLYDSDPISVPALPEEEYVECPCCSGFGSHCCGCSCDECAGLGREPVRIGVKVGRWLLADDLLRRIDDLGADLYGPLSIAEDAALRFVRGDIEGLVKPMKKPSACDT